MASALAGVIAIMLGGTAAHAERARAPANEEDESPACRRLRAAGVAEAALLFAPELSAQLVRVPESGDIDGSGLLSGSATQVRASVSVSLLDMRRGRLVRRAAERECARADAGQGVRRVLARGDRYGEAAALRAHIAALDAALPRADELVDAAEERVAEEVGTVLELDQLRRARLALARARVHARRELAALEAGSDESDREALDELVATYERATGRAERARSRIRRLDAWHVRIRGGVIPDDTDWFALLEVGYDFGQPWQRRAERRYLDARRDELAASDRELRVVVARFQRAIAATVEPLAEERALVAEEIALIDAEIRNLERVETDNAAHERALLTLERWRLEADRRYLDALLAARRNQTQTHAH